jgi:hypothetical protein
VWIDEAFTVNTARLSVTALLAAARTDVHPPLYALLMHFWVAAFGASEFSIRLPSAIFGSLAVLWIVRLGRRWLGRDAGLAAGLLAALSVFAIHYSQEARNYALMALLTLLSMDAYERGLAGWTTRRALGYLLPTIALVYSHHYGWFAILAQDVHAVLLAARARERRPWLVRWAIVQSLLLAAFAPWIPVLAGQVTHASTAFWATPPTALNLAKLAWEYAGSAPLLLLDAALVAWGVVAIRRDAARRPPLVLALLALWSALPIAVPFALAAGGTGVFLTRMTLSSCFALTLLAGAGLAAVPRRAWWAMGFLALSVPALLGYERDVHKEPWRAAVATLEAHARAGDLVVVHSGYNLRTSYAYYARRGDVVPMAVDRAGANLDAAFTAELRDSLAHHPRAWLVLSRSDDRDGVLRRVMGEGRRESARFAYRSRSYEPARSRDFAAIEVLCFERPSAATQAPLPGGR